MNGFDFLLAFGHIIYGGFFFYQGLQHFLHSEVFAEYATLRHVPHPVVAVYVSGLLILSGGLLLIAGRFVSIGSTLIIAFLLPVTFIMHAFWKETDPQWKIVEQTNFLKNSALLGAAIIILAHSL